MAELVEGADKFYFIALIENKTTLTVIDLSFGTDYERNDWSAVDDENYETHALAICAAREMARFHGLKYKPFESRYDDRLNEYPAITMAL